MHPGVEPFVDSRRAMKRSNLFLVILACICTSASAPAQYFELKNTITAAGNGTRTLGDYDGDGWIDWLSVSANGDLEIVWAVGSSSPSQTTVVLANPPGIVLGTGYGVTSLRYDGDMYDDILVLDTQGRITVYRSTGNGAFGFAGVNSVLTLGVTRIHDIADLDGDGDDDLVVGSTTPPFAFAEVVRVMRNTPSGWTVSAEYPSRLGFRRALLDDFTGDGLADLAYLYEASAYALFGPVNRHVFVRQQTVSGSFGPESALLLGNLLPIFSGGREVDLLDSADTDADGASEIFFAEFNSQAPQQPHDLKLASVDPALILNGTVTAGSYTIPQTPGTQFLGPHLADISGDGLLDVSYGIGPCIGFPTCQIAQIILENEAQRQFLSLPQPFSYSGSGVVAEQHLLDFDDDGDADLLQVSLPGQFGVFSLSYYENRAWTRLGCANAVGGAVSVQAGLPNLGQPLTVAISGAPAGATGAIGISLASQPTSSASCGVGLSLQDLIIPTISGLGLIQTDAQGRAAVQFDIPPQQSLAGTELWVQAAVLDPFGLVPVNSGLFVSTSDMRLLIAR